MMEQLTAYGMPSGQLYTILRSDETTSQKDTAEHKRQSLPTVEHVSKRKKSSRDAPRVFIKKTACYLKNNELWGEISDRNRSTAVEYSWDVIAKQTEIVLVTTTA